MSQFHKCGTPSSLLASGLSFHTASEFGALALTGVWTEWILSCCTRVIHQTFDSEKGKGKDEVPCVVLVERFCSPEAKRIPAVWKQISPQMKTLRNSQSLIPLPGMAGLIIKAVWFNELTNEFTLEQKPDKRCFAPKDPRWKRENCQVGCAHMPLP